MKAHSVVTLLLIFCLMTICAMQAGAEQLKERLERDARLHEEMGDGYFHRDSLRDAALEWEKAVRLAPEYASPYFKLASLYCKSGLVEKSIYYLERGLLCAPSNAFGHYNLAVLKLYTGRDAEAEDHLITALRILPGRGSALACRCNSTTSSYVEPIPLSLRAHCLLGYLYHKRGDRRRALFELRHSFFPLEQLCSDESPEFRVMSLLDLMLGQNLSLTGSGLDAVVRSPHFIAFTAEEGRVLYRRDAVLTLSKKGELVTQEGYRTGIFVPENTSMITINADGTITGLSSVKKAKTLTLGKLRLFTFPSPWALRAIRSGSFAATTESGRPESASPGKILLTSQYRRMALPLTPAGDDWVALIQGGMKIVADAAFCTAADSGGIDDEIAIYEEALKSPERSWMGREEALSHLGSLYYRKGDTKKALDSLSMAMIHMPRSPFIHFNTGFVYWKTGRHDDAAKEFRSALADSQSIPSGDVPDMLMGRTLLFLGLHEKEHREDGKALKYLKDSIALDPSTGYEAYLPIAEILSKKGEKTSSLIYLFEFLNACVTATKRPLDLAIFGDASFKLKDDSGKAVLSRRGSFIPDKNGEIITDEGLHTGIMLPEGAHDLWFSEDGELSGWVRNREKKKFGRLEIVGGSAEIKSRLVGGALNKKTLLGDDELEGWRLLTRLTSASGGSFVTVCRAIVKCQRIHSVMQDPGPWPNDPVTGVYLYVKPPPPEIGPSLWEEPASAQSESVDSSGDAGWQLFSRYLRTRPLSMRLFEERMKEVKEESLRDGKMLTNFPGKYVSGKPLSLSPAGAAKVTTDPGKKKFFEESFRELGALPCSDNDIVICLCEAFKGAAEETGAPRDVMEKTVRELESLSAGPEKSTVSAFYCAWIHDMLGEPDRALEKYQQFLDMEEKGSSLGTVLPLPLRARIMRLNGMKDLSLLESLFPSDSAGFFMDFSPTSMGKKGRVNITALSGEERVLYALSRSGLLQEKKGSFDKAIACYRRYMQMRGLENPDISAFILQSLTRVYYKAGLLDEVRNELDLMNLDIQVRNLSLANLFTLLGDAYLKKGEEGKAYECYATARQIQRELGSPEQKKSITR